MGVRGRLRRETSWRRFVEHVQTAPGRLPVSVRQEVFRLAGGHAPVTRNETEPAEVPADLASFVSDVADRSYGVTDGQIAELRDAGYSEDQIFEVVVVAAVGAASVHLDAAHRAMEDG